MRPHVLLGGLRRNRHIGRVLQWVDYRQARFHPGEPLQGLGVWLALLFDSAGNRLGLKIPVSRLYAVAGYALTELADHESDLVQKLKGLSPEAFQSVVDLVEDYLALGSNDTRMAFVPVKIDEPNNDITNE